MGDNRDVNTFDVAHLNLELRCRLFFFVYMCSSIGLYPGWWWEGVGMIDIKPCSILDKGWYSGNHVKLSIN